MDIPLHQQFTTTKNVPRLRRLLRRGAILVLLLVGALWVGDTTVTFLVEHSRLRARITARLEAAFGRPVEVGSYAFSVWGGPVLEADGVRIGEDPRFGHEYFLRADSISVDLRWWSLLLGHIELGTLSVNGASLNLVRNADGDWNLAEWLPRPPAAALPGADSTALPAPSAALQFHRIEISDSRIDFKRGDQKLAFALVDVNGSMDTDAPGRWRINMSAAPWRAAVITQQPGVIRMIGHIGGTSSRLRPAALQISWTNASISDLFRLLRGDDFGIRGDVDVAISALTEPREPVNGWVLSGVAELRGLHRWDIAARPDNPALNVVVKQALLDPGLSEIRAPDLRIEAPHSTANASAAFNWTEAVPAGKAALAPSNFIDLISSEIDLGDVLKWARAFDATVPDGTSARGVVGVRAHFRRWPPILTAASVTGDRAELIVPGLGGALRIGPLDLVYNRAGVSLQPVTLAWSNSKDRAAGSFRIDASAGRRNSLFPVWKVVGNADDARDISAILAALGLDFSRGWVLHGPFSCDVQWRDGAFPWDALPTGQIALGMDGTKSGATFAAPFLNFPVEQIRARVETKSGTSHVTLTSAKAFGANWNGTFERKAVDAEWRFAVSADRMSAANLDRWLDPRWRESFLDRVLPFLGPPATAASPDDLRASGTLELGEFALGPLAVRHLRGNLTVDGRHIELSDASGQFYGGEANGLLRATLSSTPDYHAEITLSRVNAASLGAASPTLTGLRANVLDGTLSIDAKGAARADLISSLDCRGTANATGLELSGLDLEKALGGSQSAKRAEISASSAFTCSQRVIRFQKLSLVLGDARSAIGSGSIGFDRSLDIRLQDSSAGPSSRATTFRLRGDLQSPRITRIVPSSRQR